MNLPRYLIAAVLLVSFPTAHALGPVDGELGLVWWANDFEGDIDDFDVDAGAIGAYGELWLDNAWGVRGTYYESDLEDVDLDSRNHYNIDIKRRFLSATDNTYGAIGLGWENINLERGGSASGIRLVGEGRLGLVGIVYLYGIAAWMPDLGDAGARRDMEATEYEVGVVIDPLPFVSLRAGYRVFELDSKGALGKTSSKSDGFLLGAGIHW